MRTLLLFPLLAVCACAFGEPAKSPATKSAPPMVEYKPKLPSLPSQKAPSGVKVPSLPRVMLPCDAKNMAYRKLVTSDYGALYGSLDQVADGQKDVWMTLNKDLRWVQIDLSVPCQVYAIHLWHGFAAPYVYRDVVIQVSDDKNFREGVRTLFNNSRDKKSRFGIGPDQPYIESRNGLLLDTSGSNKLGIITRYVRFWSNGNQLDAFNRYLEIAVIGTTDLEPVKFELPPPVYQGAAPRNKSRM